MPDWLTDLNNIGSLSSIIALVVTIFLFIEAKKIKNSFLRKARLPEVIKELAKSNSQLSEHLLTWDTDKTPAIETFSKVKALLENINPKLPSKEKKKVNLYLLGLSPKKYLFFAGTLSELNEDEAWSRYTELSGLVTTLQQLAKDTNWD